LLPAELAGCENFLTADGDLRTLPCQWLDSEPRFAGLDGFYAVRFDRF
jgi:16S rRNA (cytosine967-C5)-methyltransferase